jgi:hypothetical protein
LADPDTPWADHATTSETPEVSDETIHVQRPQ